MDQLMGYASEEGEESDGSRGSGLSEGGSDEVIIVRSTSAPKKQKCMADFFTEMGGGKTVGREKEKRGASAVSQTGLQRMADALAGSAQAAAVKGSRRGGQLGAATSPSSQTLATVPGLDALASTLTSGQIVQYAAQEYTAVLDCLERTKEPVVHATERERTIKTNEGKYCMDGNDGVYMKSKNAQRAKALKMQSEFTERGLIVWKEKNWLLTCTLCRCMVVPKTTQINQHVATHKHRTSEAEQAEKKAATERACANIETYNSEVRPLGSTLPMEQIQFRYEVFCSFLGAGVSLSKIEQMRGPYEKLGWSLGSTATHTGITSCLH